MSGSDWVFIIIFGLFIAFDGVKMYLKYRLKMAGKDNSRDIDS